MTKKEKQEKQAHNSIYQKRMREFLESYIKDKGLQNQEIAIDMGIDKTTFSKKLKGSSSFDIEDLAEFYRCYEDAPPLEEILGLEKRVETETFFGIMKRLQWLEENKYTDTQINIDRKNDTVSITYNFLGGDICRLISDWEQARAIYNPDMRDMCKEKSFLLSKDIKKEHAYLSDNDYATFLICVNDAFLKHIYVNTVIEIGSELNFEELPELFIPFTEKDFELVKRFMGSMRKTLELGIADCVDTWAICGAKKYLSDQAILETIDFIDKVKKECPDKLQFYCFPFDYKLMAMYNKSKKK